MHWANEEQQDHMRMLAPVPPDLERCQTERPSTWPAMPSFMTLGPVTWARCTNRPTWIASDRIGEMSLCDECKKVCERHVRCTYRAIAARLSEGREE